MIFLFGAGLLMIASIHHEPDMCRLGIEPDRDCSLDDQYHI